MDLSAGLVGLPNVGKSTLFNTLPSATADSGNYPFCTIDPNVAVVPVPDPRLEELVDYYDTDEIVPAKVEVHDIAGLVEGASEGEGLGNEFLRNIADVSALVHVVRCFDSDDVAHVEGSVDPVRDVDVVETELVLADLEWIDKEIEVTRRAISNGDEEAEDRLPVLEKLAEALDAGRPARAVELDDLERRHLGDAPLLTMKPVLYVANVGEEDLVGGSAEVEALREEAARRGGGLWTVCAQLEAELAELERDEQREMLEELGIDEPALDGLVREIYELLGLQSFFTAGPVEVRAWTIEQGATAADAADRIHSDFRDEFIRAEVYTLEDLRRHGDEAGIREAGEVRVVGEDYQVEDGDVLFFRHDA